MFGAEYCDATAAGNGVTQDPGCYCPDALSSGRNVLIKTTDLNDKVRAMSMLLWCDGSRQVADGHLAGQHAPSTARAAHT